MFSFVRNRILKNPSFARKTNDQWAFGIFVFGGHLALWYEIFYVLPFYHPPGSTMERVHTGLAFTLYLHWLISLYRFTSTRVTGEFSALHSQQQDTWRYCTSCIGYQPLRSHHCTQCDACVLKRDHHCWFSGCCVGHANHRFYCSMIVNVWFAALYANFFHLDFLRHVMGGLGFGTWISVLLPHVAALTGFLSLHQFFVAVISFIALLTLIMVTWLVCIQVAQLRHGQTKHEREKGHVIYDLGFVDNARNVLGSRWYLACIFPWLPSPLPGDGISFPRSAKAQ